MPKAKPADSSLSDKTMKDAPVSAYAITVAVSGRAAARNYGSSTPYCQTTQLIAKRTTTITKGNQLGGVFLGPGRS